MEKQKHFQQQFQEFQKLMLNSMSEKQKENFKINEKILKKIILIHTINNYFGLQAIDCNNHELVKFDKNWAQQKENNMRKLKYINKNKQTNIQIILFTFIQQNSLLKVFMQVQNKNIHKSYQVDSIKDSEQRIFQTHIQALQKILQFGQQKRKLSSPSFMRQVPLQPGVNDRPGSRSFQDIIKSQNLPFNNPFGIQQYVGPSSRIFGDKNNNPGFHGPNPLQRYDPVDPFDEGKSKEYKDDFLGFDKFGIPINRPKQPRGSFIPGNQDPLINRPPFWK